VSAYINDLKAKDAADQARQAEQERAERERADTQARERLTPLETRVARLLMTIPLGVQYEGLSLSSLQTSLRGRWRGACHPGELGAALRKLGFTRRRQWSDGAGFRALWYRAPQAGASESRAFP
jgi:hypothetical protein